MTVVGAEKSTPCSAAPRGAGCAAALVAVRAPAATADAAAVVGGGEGAEPAGGGRRERDFGGAGVAAGPDELGECVDGDVWGERPERRLTLPRTGSVRETAFDLGVSISELRCQDDELACRGCCSVEGSRDLNEPGPGAVASTRESGASITVVCDGGIYGGGGGGGGGWRRMAG